MMLPVNLRHVGIGFLVVAGFVNYIVLLLLIAVTH